MKLYGVLVAENEGDVIEDTLEFLRNLKIFEAIFFYDLGSQDDTFRKAEKYEDILYKPQILNEVYTEKLRYDLMIKHRNFYKEGDWVAIIDADEFYVDNPIDFINLAEKENATCIKTYQADFMFTDSDLKKFEKEDQRLPIYERRKYYLVSWSEIRFYKYLPANGLFIDSKPCSYRLLNRHYPYRTPKQIKTRIKTRLETKRKSQTLPGRAEWLQVYSHNWKDYIFPHKILHEYTGGGFKFGIPEGVQWKDYYSKNPFSTLLPQIARAFMKEQLYLQSTLNTRQNIIKGNNKYEETYKFGIGSITFKDCYSKRVVREIKDNILKHEWKESIRGIKVFLRYYFHNFIKRIHLNLQYGMIWFKNTTWNITRNLKRLVFFKSTGLIRAKPNPIDLSDYSGLGVTTLSWTSGRTELVEIRIGAPDGPLFSRKGPSGSESTGKLVYNGMVFYLQDVSDLLPPTSTNTLARVAVNVNKGKMVTI